MLQSAANSDVVDQSSPWRWYKGHHPPSTIRWDYRQDPSPTTDTQLQMAARSDMLEPCRPWQWPAQRVPSTCCSPRQEPSWLHVTCGAESPAAQCWIPGAACSGSLPTVRCLRWNPQVTGDEAAAAVVCFVCAREGQGGGEAGCRLRGEGAEPCICVELKAHLHRTEGKLHTLCMPVEQSAPASAQVQGGGLLRSGIADTGVMDTCRQHACLGHV